jgi:predicted DsbA family dithiol-disulfide isomerase
VEWLRRQLGAHVEWFPYHLHPEYPPEGLPRTVLSERYGPLFATAVIALAEDAGLPYNPHPERVPNTRTALELTEWARAQSPEAHERLHDRLMDAYWLEGRDITGWDELRKCVADVDLDPDAAEQAVRSGAFAEAVDAWTGWARSHGISAIPAFVFEQRVLVSGAQPNDVLERAARYARELMAAEG